MANDESINNVNSIRKFHLNKVVINYDFNY